MTSFFRSLTTYFSSSSDRRPTSRNVRREQALSSTQDAFSLPQHSPSLRHSFSRDSSAESPSTYTYPPPQNPYDHLPPMTPGSKADRLSSIYSDSMLASDAESPTATGKRPAHLLPLHRNAISSLPTYPSLQRTWNRLHAWLSNEYTELGDSLNYGALPDTLIQVENQLGFSLPPAVRDSYLAVDGQDPESSSGSSEGLFFGLTFLPIDKVLAEWMFWREVDDDPDTGANQRLRTQMRSVPPNWVRQEYSCRGWLPLITDRGGNYLGVDLDPGEAGTPGQVIVFGRDFDTKVVMRRGEGTAGWATWLASFVEDLESGDGFEIPGQGDGGSDGSEDDIGYESYFFNPNGGSRGHGGTDGGQGLRLAGEYKGWNVLEAWADKSMRSWAESGLGLEAVDNRHEDPSANANLGLGVFGLRSGNGAEIPIPVLAEDEAARDSDFDGTRVPYGSRHHVDELHQAEVMPTISVTVPPPQPLELPTRSDLVTSLFPPLLDDPVAGMPPPQTGDPQQGRYGMQDMQDPRTNSIANESGQRLEDEELTKAALLPLPLSTAVSPALSVTPSPLLQSFPHRPAQSRAEDVSSFSSLPPSQSNPGPVSTPTVRIAPPPPIPDPVRGSGAMLSSLSPREHVDHISDDP